ncbi:hypothetical protein E2C01_089445 [Portunus trituberculatus]|uniref:Uncharacterized protein n=1 Tax=Portunus trituberculatus TaxID=210409 RepID=A0A5B7JIT3_PORTR|nr:hypothetical protein [Portunus trituberculatus]
MLAAPAGPAGLLLAPGGGYERRQRLESPRRSPGGADHGQHTRREVTRGRLSLAAEPQVLGRLVSGSRGTRPARPWWRLLSLVSLYELITSGPATT